MKVLVVYKQSFLESHRHDRKTLARLDPAARARFIRADIENRQAIRHVARFLEKAGVCHEVVFRGSIAARRKYDLVLTVGGDGTFFAASHYVRETPILAINSDPSTSLGLFACCDRDTYRPILEKALAGKLSATKLNRLEIRVNGKPVRTLVTNDVLFAHKNPAAMTRYTLGVDGAREDQKSSGMWIACAAGSTAGIRAAGGARMPLASRQMQYLVREPYGWPNNRYLFVRGFADRQIDLAILITEAALWIDGSRTRVDVTLGDRIEIRTGATPLTLLGYDDRRRVKLFP